MNQFKNYALVVVIILSMVLGLLYNSERKERIRFESNQHSLLSEVKLYKSKDSLNVASVEKLTLTNNEFREFNQGLVKTVESLNLKIRRLQSVSQTSTNTIYKPVIQIKDSLIYMLGKVETLKCVDFSDKWLTVNGCVRNNQFEGIIESRDTIEQFVHRVPHKFLFFRYGTKAIRQEVISKNPHTKIEFSKYIELKR